MIIKKLLFKNREKGQFYVAVLGSIFGTLFLLCSIHYLIRINEFGSGEEILGPNTLVVQKKVTNSSALNISNNHFNLKEIKKIKKEPFILDAQAIVSNNFDVSFETSDSQYNGVVLFSAIFCGEMNEIAPVLWVFGAFVRFISFYLF